MQVVFFASLQPLISHLDLSDFCMEASASLCCYLSLCICAICNKQIPFKHVLWLDPHDEFVRVLFRLWPVCKCLFYNKKCGDSSRVAEIQKGCIQWRSGEKMVSPCVNLYFLTCMFKGFKGFQDYVLLFGCSNLGFLSVVLLYQLTSYINIDTVNNTGI